MWAAECRAKARRYVYVVHPGVGWLPGFAVDGEAMGVVEVDGVGFADWSARLASGLRWWWSGWRGVIGLVGLGWSGIRCGLWEGSGGARELGLVDSGWGGIEAGSFAALPSFLRVNRMTGL